VLEESHSILASSRSPQAERRVNALDAPRVRSEDLKPWLHDDHRMA
jgi:hypothetical protein